MRFYGDLLAGRPRRSARRRCSASPAIGGEPEQPVPRDVVAVMMEGGRRLGGRLLDRRPRGRGRGGGGRRAAASWSPRTTSRRRSAARCWRIPRGDLSLSQSWPEPALAAGGGERGVDHRPHRRPPLPGRASRSSGNVAAGVDRDRAHARMRGVQRAAVVRPTSSPAAIARSQRRGGSGPRARAASKPAASHSADDRGVVAGALRRVVERERLLARRAELDGVARRRARGRRRRRAPTGSSFRRCTSSGVPAGTQSPTARSSSSPDGPHERLRRLLADVQASPGWSARSPANSSPSPYQAPPTCRWRRRR